jgi:hypothetical protein
MTRPSLPFPFGLSVRSVLKPKGFEDTDGHCLPVENRTDADADGRADARKARDLYHRKHPRGVRQRQAPLGVALYRTEEIWRVEYDKAEQRYRMNREHGATR